MTEDSPSDVIEDQVGAEASASPAADHVSTANVPAPQYRGATSDPVFGFMIAAALSVGLTPLLPDNADLRYTLGLGRAFRGQRFIMVARQYDTDRPRPPGEHRLGCALRPAPRHTFYGLPATVDPRTGYCTDISRHVRWQFARFSGLRDADRRNFVFPRLATGSIAILDRRPIGDFVECCAVFPGNGANDYAVTCGDSSDCHHPAVNEYGLRIRSREKWSCGHVGMPNCRQSGHTVHPFSVEPTRRQPMASPAHIGVCGNVALFCEMLQWIWLWNRLEEPDDEHHCESGHEPADMRPMGYISFDTDPTDFLQDVQK